MRCLFCAREGFRREWIYDRFVPESSLSITEAKAHSYLDIKMSDVNGFALYREIKKLDKKVKACFCTGWRNVLRRIFRYIFFTSCQLLYSKTN